MLISVRSVPPFLLVTGSILLFATGILKLITVLSEAPFLQANAPLFTWLSWRQLLFIACTTEFVCATVVLRYLNEPTGAFAMLWIALMLLLYRVGMVIVDYTGPCECLGSLRTALGLTTTQANSIAWQILAYLLGGGLVSIMFHFPRIKARCLGGTTNERNLSGPNVPQSL
jgi:hypothetical protein